MSRTRKYNDKYGSADDYPARRRRSQRRLTARAVRRADPDLRRMGKALIVYALAEAEAAAEQQRAKATKRPSEREGQP